MTGAVHKTSALAAAMVFAIGAIGLLCGFYPATLFAQDESIPEALPTEEPQGEPTYWSPITAGDAERGAPPASIQATPAIIEATPQATEVAAPSEVTDVATPSESATPSEAPSPAPTPATTAPSATQHRARTSAKAAAPAKAAGGAGAIVPENSPFAAMNFANSKGPTNIKSDSMNLDYKGKAILFTGHVHAVQGAGDLTSDTLRVQYGKDFNDIQMMYADGNVRMSQGTRWITSDHAVLDQSKHLVTFHGNPVAHDGEDQITGSVIAVDLVTGKSTVQKPRVIIFPRDSKNPDNGAATNSP
jgi:lipopolysaccharide transport protein LptA